MALSKKQLQRLNMIVETVNKVIATDKQEGPGRQASKTRIRRSSTDAAKMKVKILAARAKGVPAAKLAEKFGVSTAYIYMQK